MAPYRFRLATLQKLREAARNAERGRLAEAQQAASVLQQQLRQLEQRLAEAQRLQRAATNVGRVDVNRLLESQRYQATLKAEWQALQKQAALISQEVARRQQVTRAAEREVQKLERLDEKWQQRHEQAERRVEMLEANEIAAQQFRRRSEL